MAPGRVCCLIPSIFFRQDPQYSFAYVVPKQKKSIDDQCSLVYFVTPLGLEPRTY